MFLRQGNLKEFPSALIISLVLQLTPSFSICFLGHKGLKDSFSSTNRRIKGLSQQLLQFNLPSDPLKASALKNMQEAQAP